MPRGFSLEQRYWDGLDHVAGCRLLSFMTIFCLLLSSRYAILIVTGQTGEPQMICHQILLRKFLLAICFALLAGVSTSWGVVQTTTDSKSTVLDEAQIQAHLDAGELPLAQAIIRELPPQSADQWRSRLAQVQANTGSAPAAFATAATLQNDVQRSELLSRLSRESGSGAAYSPSESGVYGNPAAGNSHDNFGGITIRDFQQLMGLITNTISNDSWLENGGVGTMQAFPAGVFVDSEGALKRVRTSPGQSLLTLRSQALFDSGNRQPQLPADLRKVSLTRLEKAVQLQVAQGRPIDETMLNLAGITEIKYVIALPESGEVIIAGPAGPWEKDPTGRSVNRQSGDPVLQLDDFVVCLRNALENNGRFGCSINPRQQNLANTQQFLADSKLKGRAWSKQLRENLGQQDIEVFGLDSQTHAARVLVEADYRMKLIGMGLEPSIAEVPSFLARVELTPEGTVPPLDVVRWWFTMNYDDVFSDEAKQVFTFTGTGVRVLSENELLGEQGKRIHTGQSHGPTKSFAQDFTKHYGKIADQYPIYRELKNVFDMALVANLIRQFHLAEQTDWHVSFFGPPKADQLSYPVRKSPAPVCVDSVMNERVINVRKQNSTVKHTLVGVSGGIDFDASKVISIDQIKFSNTTKLTDAGAAARPADDQPNWWWD